MKIKCKLLVHCKTKQELTSATYNYVYHNSIQKKLLCKITLQSQLLLMHIWTNIQNLNLNSNPSYLDLRQNSFIALTPVMKLFCVYFGPYSLFLRTAFT